MNKQNWTYKKLGEVVAITMGQSPASDTYNESEGLPFFQGNADFGKEHPSVRIYCNSPIRIADSGDILISVRAPIGAINIADRKCCIGRGLAAIRGNDNYMSRFIYYLLMASKEKLVSQGTGSTFKSIGKDVLYNMLIPVPPLSTQSRIVAELDLLQSIIDKQKAQLKEYDTLAQSIFYDMFGDPVENEKGWDVVEMRSLFDIGSSKRVFESQWTDEGVPFYRAREIVRLSRNEPIESPIFISEPLFKEYSTKYGIPSEGDIMVTAVGTLGVCYLVKKTDRFYFKDGNLLWFRDKGVCDTRFIKDQYTTDFVRNQIQGNANAAVVGTYTITNANKTKVILPPLDLQKKYVKKVEAIERQKELINQSIAEAQTLFDSRMDYYFG